MCPDISELKELEEEYRIIEDSKYKSKLHNILLQSYEYIYEENLVELENELKVLGLKKEDSIKSLANKFDHSQIFERLTKKIMENAIDPVKAKSNVHQQLMSDLFQIFEYNNYRPNLPLDLYNNFNSGKASIIENFYYLKYQLIAVKEKIYKLALFYNTALFIQRIEGELSPKHMPKVEVKNFKHL